MFSRGPAFNQENTVHVYQLYITAKEMQYNVLMLKQIEEMKELRIPSIVLSTKKNVLLQIGKGKYKLFSEDNVGHFECQNARFSAHCT